MGGDDSLHTGEVDNIHNHWPLIHIYRALIPQDSERKSGDQNYYQCRRPK